MADSVSDIEGMEEELRDRLSRWFHLMEERGLTIEDIDAAIGDSAVRQALMSCWQATRNPGGAGLSVVGQDGGFVPPYSSDM